MCDFGINYLVGLSLILLKTISLVSYTEKDYEVDVQLPRHCGGMGFLHWTRIVLGSQGIDFCDWLRLIV